jgi:para-aminobenzoate synthetase component 1
LNRIEHPFLALAAHLRKEGPVVWIDAEAGDVSGDGCSYLAARPVREQSFYQTNGSAAFWRQVSDFLACAKKWYFGFVTFDAGQPYSKEVPALTEQPDAWFMEPGLLFKLDHTTNVLETLIGTAPEVTSGLGGYFKASDAEPFEIEPVYHQKIQRIKRYIKEGDFYEMNYTIPFCGTFDGDSLAAYSKGRSISQAPFSAYLSGQPGPEVLCFSPERFLQRRGTILRSEPIKGTRPNPNGQNRGGLDLAEAQKDRAEHLMIVDLVRNDLSKVCQPGTVAVKRLFEVRSFKTVHQMVSVVEGELLKECGFDSIMEACFPMGSMTGAPKKRVLQATAELEPWSRGLYSGAIGMITPGGDFDFNVVIRTMLVQDGRYVWGAGGGITSDSDPEEEWKEVLAKIKVLTSIADQARSTPSV